MTSGASPGAMGAPAVHCSNPTSIRASSRAISAWSRVLSCGSRGLSSAKIRRRLMVRVPWRYRAAVDGAPRRWQGASGAQAAQVQYAAQQEFEGFQVPARLVHVAAPGIQAMAIDQIAP